MGAEYGQTQQIDLATLTEIWPDAASARVAPVYEDLRTALRIPDVPFPFRFLAAWPPYLAFAVRQFSPFIRSSAFEAASDALRALAVDQLATLAAPGEPFVPARQLILREHDLGPRLLLVLTAFAVGLVGRTSDANPPATVTVPDREPIPVRPAELPRQIDERVPPLPDFRTLPDAARALLDDLAQVRGAPCVDDLSRGLALLAPEAVRTLAAQRRGSASQVAAARAALVENADRAVRRFTLPGIKVLPDFAVPTAAIPAITAATLALQRVALEALLDATLARLALDGAEAARHAPFPVSVRTA